MLIRPNSLNRRLSRLRSTDEWPCFGTTKPIRDTAPVAKTTLRSRLVVRRRLPSRTTARRSLPRVSRCRRCSRWSALNDDGSGACVLGRELHREALTSFPATTTEYFASPLGRHPLAKAMRANASLVPGTIGGLAHDNSKDAVEISAQTAKAIWRTDIGSSRCT